MSGNWLGGHALLSLPANGRAAAASPLVQQATQRAELFSSQLALPVGIRQKLLHLRFAASAYQDGEAHRNKPPSTASILINNAGIGGNTPFLETTLENWNRTIAINLTGAFIVAQTCAKSRWR